MGERKIIMILHKYIDKHGIDVLENCKLKVNAPTNYNDPFELLCRSHGELTRKMVKSEVKNKQKIRKLYDQTVEDGYPHSFKVFKKHVDENRPRYIEQIYNGYPKRIKKTIRNMPKMANDYMRVTCFSGPIEDKLKEILMWSHYTDAHKGMRIHFDTEYFYDRWRQHLGPIQYSETRVPIHVKDLFWDTGMVEEAIRKSVRWKSLAWKYENEYRLIIRPSEAEPAIVNGKNIEFVKFNPGAIKRVDFGVNMLYKNKEKVMDVLRNNSKFNNVKLTEAVMDDDIYKLNYDNLNF